MRVYKNESIIVGILMISAFFLYGNGMLVIPSLPGIGTMLILLNSVAVISIGILLFPMLGGQNHYIALTYLLSRVFEGVFLSIGGLFLAMQGSSTLPLPLLQAGNQIAYLMGMMVLGLGSLAFCKSFMKSRLIPLFLSWWGFVGYFLLSVGCAIDILFGTEVGLYFLIPGGLFELFFAIWLIARGFRTELKK